MHPHALDPAQLSRSLASELRETAHLPALQDATAASSDPQARLQSLLDLAAELILKPDQTVRVARAVRPLLLDVVARALSGVRNATISARPTNGDTAGNTTPQASATSLEQAEVVLVAMSRLLPAAPHVLPLALHHWRVSVCPFDILRIRRQATANAPGVDDDAEPIDVSALAPEDRKAQEQGQRQQEATLRRVHMVTEAAHKLLASDLGIHCLRQLWNWAPFFDLCRHEDVLVRWRAVGVVSLLLALDERGRRELQAAVGASEYRAGTDALHAFHVVPHDGAINEFGSGGKEIPTASAAARAGSSDQEVLLLEAGLKLSEDLRQARSALVWGRRGVSLGDEGVLHQQQQRARLPSKARNNDAVQDPAVSEMASSEAFPSLPQADVSYDHHPAVADIGGILHVTAAPTDDGNCLGRGGGAADRTGGRGPPRLVPTATAQRNVASLSLAMTVARPILLHGPVGCGKSLLAREVARLAGGQTNSGESGYSASTSMLELHLDDQTDSKSLLGAHACTDVPGEFAWRPGALTRAAAAGTWVLIEDLDRAPFEVLAALGPLLEGRPLALPGRKKPLIAAPGFRVFGTVTTVGPGKVVLGGAADFGALWIHVAVEPLSVSETLEVARARHPSLPCEVLRRLSDTMLLAGGFNHNGVGFALSRSLSAGGGRQTGVRDFFKLCARVERLGLFDISERMSGNDQTVRRSSPRTDTGQDDNDVEGGSASEAWFCSEAQALPMMLESLDVFAGHLTTKNALSNAAKVLAGQWNILPSKAVELATTVRPELIQGDDYLRIGRITLPRVFQNTKGGLSTSFAPTSHALRLMEKLAASVEACEPVLLVGETGCGKTALVQRLAEGTGRQLVVQNLSLQTEGADLLGGFRPVELRQLAQEVLEVFLQLFPLLFSASQNARFCQAITLSFERRQWKRLSAGLRNAAKMANEKFDRSGSEERSEKDASEAVAAQTSNKSRRAGSLGDARSPSGQRRDWERFAANVDRFERQRVAVEGSFAFSFVEGVLVKAIREGKWVLLDEINLASAETLQRLSGLLEGADGSICLTERGDVDPIVRHPDFRLFAAMNPPTDASKKDLPPALRRRFSEVYVPELEDRMDLKRVADRFLSGVSLEQEHLAFTAVDLYLWARGLAAESLSDGAGQRPRYSLRTFVGALSAARRLVDRGFNPKRGMIEGFRGAFETQLDSDGRARILRGIMKAFGKGMTPKDLEKPPRRPGGRPGGNESWVRIGPFWLEGGPLDTVDAAVLDPETKQRKFVTTPSVQATLRCLSRAVASADSPVLLQGPTSAGKTSIVEYLAARLGHRCVRINNHEHTDIQEYTGSYAADGNGKLAFQEGILVESLRKGYWIILDELNLAPSEVLEALNRLLDHNRELYLSETQETIKPHPSFRLFATQNPPGAYGGRKPLSRAFRNRFMEVHVDDIPGIEWETILTERCGLPPSHCKLLVKVLHELQAQRQSSRLFLGKHSAISPRDLLRWAGRKPQGKQQLAEEGFMLLAERLRSDEEKSAMKAVLEEQIGVPLDPDCLYGTTPPPSRQEQDDSLAGDTSEIATKANVHVNELDLGGFSQLSVVEEMLDRGMGLDAGLQGIAMTRHMRRLFRLSGRCLSHQEPLLLVGATGCGKTTVCQLYSMLLKRRMHVINCHQNTEAADLLGGLRPLRGRDRLVTEFRKRAQQFLCLVGAASAYSFEVEETPEEVEADWLSLAHMDVSDTMAKVQAAWAKLTNEASHASTNISNSPSASNAQPGTQKRARSGDYDLSAPGRSESVPFEGQRDSSVGPSRVLIPEAASIEGTVNDADLALPSPSAIPGSSQDDPSKGRGKRRRKMTKIAAEPPPKTAIENLPGSETHSGTVAVPGRSKQEAAIIDKKRLSIPSAVCAEKLLALEKEFASLQALANRTKGLFEWVDGPLVTSMRKGEMLLLDELSLAEDAVLERLNSVLEPGRSITLAEKGGEGADGGGGAAETVVAAPGFRVMATMNPGGDFGKRELSPALRSRFTEVWVPALLDREDMEGVVQKALRLPATGHGAGAKDMSEMAAPMLDFAWWFNNTASPTFGGGHELSLSVRDLRSWAGFISSSMSGSSLPLKTQCGRSALEISSSPEQTAFFRPWEAYVHGAALTLLDGMGLGAGLSSNAVATLRRECGVFLSEQIPECPERTAARAQLKRDSFADSATMPLEFVVRSMTSTSPSSGTLNSAMDDDGDYANVLQFGISPFFTPCGPNARVRMGNLRSSQLHFSLRAPTTSKNLHRVLRALQVRKAVLLEGSPGVGKTSLVAALAAATGHELVRINLSEQTDLSDLFGSDLPVPDSDGSEIVAGDLGGPTDGRGPHGGGARFAWRDGVFLRALKEGKWVLLDELNLATQSVLEGLNACLDHRAEVYIPELGRSFRCPPTFKVFAAQNPLGQGGGRKGLPRSFLSRFTKVFVDPLTPGDLLYIAANKFPALVEAGAATDGTDCANQDGLHSPQAGVLPPVLGNDSLLARMISFNSLVQEDTMESGMYGRKGSPWEFNLRDVFRWCELMLREQQLPAVEDNHRRSMWEPWLLVDTLYLQRMRTRADRAGLLERFKEVFPEAFSSTGASKVGEAAGSHVVTGGIGSHPLLKVTPDWLQIGETVLRRGCWAQAVGSGGAKAFEGLPYGVAMPMALRRPLQALARCVAMGWPSLVVGHRGSGKTTLIQGLAAGVGARLTEVAMTPSIDVTELLGCYEQTDARAEEDALFECLGSLAENTCLHLLVNHSFGGWQQRIAGAVWDAWYGVQRCCGDLCGATVRGETGSSSVMWSGEQVTAAVDNFLGVIDTAAQQLEQECNVCLDAYVKTKTGSPHRLALSKSINHARKLAASVRRQVSQVAGGGEASHTARKHEVETQASSAASCFKWSDGILVEALERGDWLVLDAANLCSPSVLDRLSPLLEPGGVLLLTEGGATTDDSCADGNGEGSPNTGAAPSSHRVIRPHPNFRLFLTADPSCGEVSRAMRNRCVEIFLMDTPPAVTPTVVSESSRPNEGEHWIGDAAVAPFSHHASDLVSLIGASGIADPEQTMAILTAHSVLVSRCARGKGEGAGEGPAPRAIALWSQLIAAMRSRATDGFVGAASLRSAASLAYPGLRAGAGSRYEWADLDAAARWADDGVLVGSGGAEEDVVSMLVQPGWRQVLYDGVHSQVESDSNLLRLLCASGGLEGEHAGNRRGSVAGFRGASHDLVWSVVGVVDPARGPLNADADFQMESDDELFFTTPQGPLTIESAGHSTFSTLIPYSTMMFARRTCHIDRTLRSISAGRLSIRRGTDTLAANIGMMLPAMTATLYDHPSWTDVSEMLADLVRQAGLLENSSSSERNFSRLGDLKDRTAAGLSMSSTLDPRSSPNFFSVLKRAASSCTSWKAFTLLLALVDSSFGRRLPARMRWMAEIEEALMRTKSARGEEVGLGWIGLSYLACEGGRDLSRAGSYSGSLRCPQTRHARSALVPYLLPLFRALDNLLETVLCKKAAEMAACAGDESSEKLLVAFAATVSAQDTLSDALRLDQSAGPPGPDASAGRRPLVFPWESFLVACRWVYRSADELHAAFVPAFAGLPNVTQAWASLASVRARMDAAILAHAGGAVPARDTLWKHGSRAVAASSSVGAYALGRLHRLADEFRVLPPVAAAREVEKGHGCVSLGSLMHIIHPVLCVSNHTRVELLHALCTLHWAASSEYESRDPSVLSKTVSGSGLTEVVQPDGKASIVALAETLPRVLEEAVKASRSRFKAGHTGTRLDIAAREDGLEQDHEFDSGEQFDAFETEAQEAVANATLLVMSSGDGEHRHDGVDGVGGNATSVPGGGNILQRWALVQLAPFSEHWLTVEECEILASLACLQAAMEIDAEAKPTIPAMARIKRLRSAMLATPSLSPVVARPYQTLLWAWENQSSLPMSRSMLSKVLPVALESWGRRLWENLFRLPGGLSFELGPPPMINDAREEEHGGGQRASHGAACESEFHDGPAQLLTLVRSSFLLHLASSAVFPGGIVPSVGAKRSFSKGLVSLNLMNASARCYQFRAAMRYVRDLRSSSSGALRPLLELAWARLSNTLCPFDALVRGDYVATFKCAFASFVADNITSWNVVESRLRRALDACPDERLTQLAESLVLPTAQVLCEASNAAAVGGIAKSGAAQALVGRGMALLGCLRLALLLPSSPVDPGLKPALKKGLLEKRVDGLKKELTVRRWSSRLEGGGDVTPEMVPLLQQARHLRDESHRLGLEAIERHEERPAFEALFRDIHAFFRGVGNPARVAHLADGLAALAGVVFTGSGVLQSSKPPLQGAVQQEEAVWQAAAGSFVSRCRSEYMEAYADVVTGVCDAVEACRVGLRMLATTAAASAVERFIGVGTDHVKNPAELSNPIGRLQMFLLVFPYSSNDAVGDHADAVELELGFASQSGAMLVSDGGDGGADSPSNASTTRHMAVLQAVLSRAELLLSSGCSETPALASAFAAMEAMVSAWSKHESDETERRRKEAEIIKYKTQEHVVQSEEAVNEARLRDLFPDYHSSFNDILATNVNDPIASATAEEAVGESQTRSNLSPEEDARSNALGQLSELQLSSLVARHARLVLSLSARRRLAIRRLTYSISKAQINTGSCYASTATRLVAFGDSYRASVLLAGPTSNTPACVPRPGFPRLKLDNADNDDDEGVLNLEEAFAPSHMLALADAARLCKSGRTLLEDTAVEPKSKKATFKDKGAGARPVVEDAFPTRGWVGDGAAGRSLLLVDTFVNFHLSANVEETRLADEPLAKLLRRVAVLLGEFRGHGILIQLARVADRVRRMPLHSPLAAVLAGIELSLRKAQDWEQHAHRGVSLKDELRALSALVVRWRAIELRSWPELLDSRERAFVRKANRWWLHLYRLLTGEWGEGMANPEDQANTVSSKPPESSATVTRGIDGSSGKNFPPPDWPSAQKQFPDWLWHGLVSEKASKSSSADPIGMTGENKTDALDHARGLFQTLDDFLRTSSVGEFFARLQMIRAFAAQLNAGLTHELLHGNEPRGDASMAALASLLQGLWQYYSQFSDEVIGARDLVRRNIEKKLKEEAKLAKWDEQTYYSLAEASEKSHRKLSKLVAQYDEVLEISVSEVLHRAFIEGIGERKEGSAVQPAAPRTEVPSVGAMFAMVKKVDTAIDFVDTDADSGDEEADTDGQQPEGFEIDGVIVQPPQPLSRKPEVLKSKTARLLKPSADAKTSLTMLDACLPKEPIKTVSEEAGVFAGMKGLSPWLTRALLGNETNTTPNEVKQTMSLTARLPGLSRRMRSLLHRGMYAQGREGGDVGRWAEPGRPAGFIGAGLAEELCLAVFGRVKALRACKAGKQVKKRAVLDLLGGMRKQGLNYAKSASPGQICDMLQVMTLKQPFAGDQLVGVERSWLMGGGGKDERASAKVLGDVLERGERYYLRGVSELSRLRLEAGAPVSGDVTRREAEIMRGLAEHLGLMIVQQRGAATALESEVSALARELNAMQSLLRDYLFDGKVMADKFAAARDGSGAQLDDSDRAWSPVASRVKPLPPQRPLRYVLETQRKGLLRAVESVREVQLLLKAMAGSDPPCSSTSPGGNVALTDWGEKPTDAAASTAAESAVSELERKISEMLSRLDRFPPPVPDSETDRDVKPPIVPLLGAGAMRDVLANQEILPLCSKEAGMLATKFAHVVPPAALKRVRDHLWFLTRTVDSALRDNDLLSFWWVLTPGVATTPDVSGSAKLDLPSVRLTSPAASAVAAVSLQAAQTATSMHVERLGNLLSVAVKAMLISVQSLCPRVGHTVSSTPGATAIPDLDEAKDDESAEDAQLSVTSTTLFQAHSSAFEQARGLKLWRCVDALNAVRVAVNDFTEAEDVNGWADGAAPAREAGAAILALLADMQSLTEQVLCAGRAVLTGIVALHKGTAKLEYVIVRVFRTLLSKGLCSGETEETEGDGDGNIDGMKFDDDVEGTGMGEGEGKKDVTDQIEDEEQLLGLKGDEPDKEKAEEPKELGEDEEDNGMEMENDFEGQMFNVPKGDDENDKDDENNDHKEELDREMGDDIGDNADVVDEKLWEEEDDDGQEEGEDQQEEKFESGSRLDGEKPEEDEIRTKEEGQEQEKDDGDGKDDNDKGAGGMDDDKKNMGDDDGGDANETEVGDDEGNGDEGEGEGPVNDDLEEKYEEKPMGVEVRGEDEAMEVEEQGADGNDVEGDEDGQEDLPDDLNLDDAQDKGENGEEGEAGEGDAEEDGDDGDEKDEGKEGFEALAPEEDGAEQAEELVEDEDQPQGSGNAGAPEVDPMQEEGADDDNQKDDGKEQDGTNDEEEEDDEDEKGDDNEGKDVKGNEDGEEPPAFGVQGDGGDKSAMLETSNDEAMEGKEGDEQANEDQDKDDAQGGGGSSPDGHDDGGGGGQGDEGEGGEWRPDMSGGGGKGDGQGQDKRRRPEAPNPFRDPGDAMRHWHRRLDMLKDQDEEGGLEVDGGGDDDHSDGQDDDGEGKFEFVTSTEQGSSQVLGGVSEEQAAEAAARQVDRHGGGSEDEQKEVEEGVVQDDMAESDDDHVAGGIDAMDHDETQVVATSKEDIDDNDQGERAERAEKTRKSGQKRDKDGHRLETEADADRPISEAEENGTDEEGPACSNALVDLKALEEAPAAADMNQAQVVTNSVDDIEWQENSQALRDELHELVQDLLRRKRDSEVPAEDGVAGGDYAAIGMLPAELWGRLRGVTAALSQRLCEQLRLVLEPMVATKLQGDYRSGKRINMRRVIPYIASGFRKDKIWLRRTKPAKRDYQILMAIDDSESMADCGAGALALAAMTTVASGLTQLEAGQLAVARFGEKLDLLHAFGDPFTEEAGARIVSQFTFNQPRTNTAHTLEGVVALLEEAGRGFSSSSGGVGSRGTPRQLVLLLSDGRFDRDNRDRLRNLVREMNERGQLLVLIVMDKEGDTSILKTREASYVGGNLVLSSYLEKYPFPFYILLNRVEALPETLADALRQWFELLQRQMSF